MSYKEVYIDEDILVRAKAALEAVASRRREQIPADGDQAKYHEDEAALQTVRQLEKDARELHFVLQDLGRKPARDEELAAIDDLIAKVSKAAGYSLAGETRAGKLSRYFHSIQADQFRAYETFATFANEMRVQVLSLKWIANEMLHCGTHREKASALAVLLAAFRAIEQSLCRVDGDPQRYETYGHNGGSWSFRDLLAEKHHLEHQLERVQDELMTLQNQMGIRKTDEQGEEGQYGAEGLGGGPF